MDLDEFNDFMVKNGPALQAIVDQQAKYTQEEAFKKWAEENPDKARMYKLFGGLGGPMP